MFNRGNSAVSIMEKLKKEQEKETQPRIQIEELQKQGQLARVAYAGYIFSG